MSHPARSSSWPSTPTGSPVPADERREAHGPGRGGAALSLIDAHQHFQDLGNHYYPWLMDRTRPPPLEGDLDPIRRDYLPADYACDVAGATIRKTVHVQSGWDPTDPVGETRWLQDMAETSGLPTAIVAFADLGAPDVERVIGAHMASQAVRGILQILNWHDDPILRVAAHPDFMGQPRWRRGFALLRRHRLSFDLKIYWQQMDGALALAAAFPDITLVLNHFGMPIVRRHPKLARLRHDERTPTLRQMRLDRLPLPVSQPKCGGMIQILRWNLNPRIDN